MFDIGFWELTLILIVALVVVGPERLPRLVRTAGLYLGRARRAVAAVKADVQRELAAEELKNALQKQAQSAGLHEIIEETQEAATAAEQLMQPEPAAAKPKPEVETARKPAVPPPPSSQQSPPESPHGGT